MAEMARIKYSKGRTVNLGNFESLRVDIGIELDCLLDLADEVYDKLKVWVDRRVQAETGR